MWALLLLLTTGSDPAATGARPASSPASPPASPPGPAAGPAVAPEVYRRPVVPPYEPPSDFGRRLAEGDAVGPARSAGGRPDAAADYLAAVEARRARAQALMGPLDGLWRVTDETGRELLDLSLTDRGPDRPLDGVWLGVTPAGAARTGEVELLARADDRASLRLDERTRLELVRTAEGWSAGLIEGRRRKAVRLVPVIP